MLDKSSIKANTSSRLSNSQLFTVTLILILAISSVITLLFFGDFFQALELRYISIGLIVSFCTFALVIISISRKKDIVSKALKASLIEYEAQKMALNQHAIVSITDAAGNVINANHKFCELCGYTEEELIGKNHNLLRSSQHSDAFFKNMWETISSGKTWHGDIRNKTKSGSYYWVNSSIFPVLDSQGNPYEYFAIGTEISEQKQIEKRLSQERQFLKGLLGALGDGVYVLNEKGLCTFVNPQAEKMLRWSMAELKGKVLHNIIHASDAEGNKVLNQDCSIMLAVKSNKVYRSEDEVFTRRGGKQFPVSIVSVPMKHNIGSVTIFKDITEQKIREQQLTTATEQAKKANLAKSDFLSRMSHELRTPMNAILGFAQLLEINDELDADDQDYVQEILKAGNHLLELINEVLDLSKIEAGRIDLSIEPVNCNEVLNECIALLSPLAEAKNIAIQYDPYQTPDVSINCDRTRLKQIIVNMMSNAIKYNHENGHIQLEVSTEIDNYWRIKVTDNGFGLPKERINELFSPFSRLVANQDEIQGSGIGLVISRQLTEAMHGTMDFESEEGVGSSFWIDLPFAKTTQEIVPSTDNESTIEISATNTHGKATILYMEDNPANLKLVEHVLGRVPEYSLVTAIDPKEGIELASEIKPDLILLDIHMPGLTGLDVLKILKNKPEFAATPFIAISANAMHHDIKNALNAGFDEYLTKPLDVELFLQTVSKYLS